MASTHDQPEALSAAAVTRLLNEAGDGNQHAASELLPLVYAQLRALAARKMRQERSEHTLQATALVHEAYLRLVDESDVRRWADRWHFFAAAAEAMRRILIEKARQRDSLKRGGAGAAGAGAAGAGIAGGNGGATGRRVELDAVELTVDDPPVDLLALDEALIEFERAHADKARLVKLRYFAGLSMEEAAQATGMSARTARRNWAFARAWLFSRLNPP